MSSGSIALAISFFAGALLVCFLKFAEVRLGWKLAAFGVFATALALVYIGGSPAAFVAGLTLQTFLTISLILYFKVGF